MTPGKIARALNWFGLAIGLFALLVQFYIRVNLMIADGRSILGALGFYFSFLTILTNWVVVLTHASLLGLIQGPFKVLSRPRIYNGVLAAIILVFCAFHLLLAGLVELTGISIVTDFILHTLAPAVFALWWIANGVHGKATKSDPFFWALWPAGYLVYTILRSFVVGEVPYPFLQYWTLGWSSVLTTSLVILLAFLVGGYLLLFIDKFLARKKSVK